MGRIGIYGGTFNPPHRGHMQAARQAVELLNLDKLLLIPDHAPPHKTMPEGTPAAQERLELVRLTAREIPPGGGLGPGAFAGGQKLHRRYGGAAAQNLSR